MFIIWYCLDTSVLYLGHFSVLNSLRQAWDVNIYIYLVNMTWRRWGGCAEFVICLAAGRPTPRPSAAPTRRRRGCSTPWSGASSSCTSRPSTSALTRSRSSTSHGVPAARGRLISMSSPSRAQCTTSSVWRSECGFVRYFHHIQLQTDCCLFSSFYLVNVFT